MSIRYGRKISELSSLATASLQNTYVVGIDNGVTYKMSLDVLEDAVTNLVSSSTDARLDSLETFTSSIPTKIANTNATASVSNEFDKTFNVIYKGDTLLLINQSGSVAINTSSFDLFYPETLLITSHDDTTYNLIVGKSNTNNYSQFNLKNQNTGSLASSDIVATTDTGDENQGYIDMGINSSTYYNPYFVGRARDAYLYSTGDDLWIGNASANKRIALFSGGPDAEANAKVYIHPQGVIGVNTSDTASSVSPALPALLVRPAVSDTYNMIYVEGNVNNYSQLNIQNVNGGVSASSDIVATNDIGTETSYYIDMGVNGSGYINNGNGVASANDAYLYSTANHLHIGNASNHPIMFFAGGLDADSHQKMILTPDNNHSITGSLSVTGDNSTIVLPNHSSAPTSPTPGALYFNTSDYHFYGWNGSEWKQLDNN